MLTEEQLNEFRRRYLPESPASFAFLRQTAIDVRTMLDEIDRLRAENAALRDANLALSARDDAVAVNGGAELASAAMHNIAEHGRRGGVFASETVEKCAKAIEKLRAEITKLHDITETQACEEEEIVMENAEFRELLRGGPDAKDGPEGIGHVAPNLELLASLFERGLPEFTTGGPFDWPGFLRGLAKGIREVLK